MGGLDLSVVVPLHNEEENVVLLHPRIEEACAGLGSFEVVLVDDGSTDATWERMETLEAKAGELVLVRLRNNAGQTPAMAAGFEVARGDIVVTMDGDLQNDPADIPALLAKCGEGYDLVCGWRKNRQDKLWTRKIPSKCANWLIRRITGVRVHDYGCSLKAYRSDLVRRMRLYSDMHRFLPFLSQQQGARIGEMVVRHHARRYGVTKYGLSRTWKVLFDLFGLKMLVHYYQRPFRWFVLLAVLPLLLSLAAGAAAVSGGAERQVVLFGTSLVFGSLALFVVFLGLLSDLALKRDWRDFERLLVLDRGGRS